MLDTPETPENTDSPNTDADNAGSTAPAKRARAPRKAAPKGVAPKAAAPKAEGRKAAALKASAPNAEAPKAEAPKAEAPKAEASRASAPTSEKLKVSDLAKELGVKSKDLLNRLEELGERGKSAASKLEPAQVDQLRAAFGPAAADSGAGTEVGTDDVSAEGTKERPAKTTSRRRARVSAPFVASTADGEVSEGKHGHAAPALAAPMLLFQAPAEAPTPGRRRSARAAAEDVSEVQSASVAEGDEKSESPEIGDGTGGDGAEVGPTGVRRRRRGRRGRGGAQGTTADTEGDEIEPVGELAEVEAESDEDEESESEHADHVAEAALSASARRRRRRRRTGGTGEAGATDDDPPNTVVHVRDTTRSATGGGGARGSEADEDGVRGVKGSTRLEAKRQRRRDNRDTGRRRAPILTEAEFLARRESVDRVMAVRQTGDRTQIAVLEDDILVEHYVTRASSASAVSNVYLGRVQNVLPSMEAAFIDIGRGRNGVLYAGEVNWDAAGLEGKARSIEGAMGSGDTVLVQVTKDPIGHKGARLTSQISLPGRFVVYVPGGGMTGISRKLPDTERSRLKSILKKVVPDDAGVIVRTAAEGASEEDLISDVERLKTQWDGIQEKAAKPGNAPTLVYGEPDLAIRVVRDVFNDDFKKLVVAGSDIHTTISDYVADVAPDLADRISLYTGTGDLFNDLRVDEQLAKALDRKVWLPSGGSLVIDRTEAMTVVDVNTGKYTGSGGNLEQTVTRNNLEAAEEIVRQLRLRDIGGIVVIDFIDMVLESNRDLVLRRLTECLGRDRTKHQVAEVTSLGLVQMTRKRVGEGLLEAFSEPCEHCKGRGVIVHSEPVDKKFATAGSDQLDEDRGPRNRRSRKPKATAIEGAAFEQVQPLDEERRRAAASAIALIAKASHHDDEAHHDETYPGESDHGHDHSRDYRLDEDHPHQYSDREYSDGDFIPLFVDEMAETFTDGNAEAFTDGAAEAFTDGTAEAFTDGTAEAFAEAAAEAGADDESAAHAFADAVAEAVGASGGNVSRTQETRAQGTRAQETRAQGTRAQETRQPAPVAVAPRPRRRRGATRPAGPPVVASEGAER